MNVKAAAGGNDYFRLPLYFFGPRKLPEWPVGREKNGAAPRGQAAGGATFEAGLPPARAAPGC